MVTLFSLISVFLSNFITPSFDEDPISLSSSYVVDLGEYGSFDAYGTNWIYFPSSNEFFSCDGFMWNYISSSGISFRLACLENFSIYDSEGEILRPATSSSFDGYFLSGSLSADYRVYICNFSSSDSGRLVGFLRNWFPPSDIETDFSDDFMNESFSLFRKFIHGFSFSLIGLFVFMLLILGFLFYSVYRMIRGRY